MKHLFRSVLLIGFTLPLLSCNGENELNAAGGNIDQATLQAVLGDAQVKGSFDNLISALAFDDSTPVNAPAGIAGELVAMSTDHFKSCTTETGSKTEDADSDGIPAEYSQKYNCKNVQNGQVDETQIGHFRVQDKDESKFGYLGGFLYDFDFYHNNLQSHEESEFGYSGTWEMTPAAQSLSLNNKYQFWVIGRHFDGSFDVNFKVQNNWKADYKPSDMSQPWMAGKVNIKGYFGVSGRIAVQANEHYDVKVAFEVEGKDLVYNKTACPSGYIQSGELTLKDASNNSITYSYDNCTQTLYYNGQVLNI